VIKVEKLPTIKVYESELRLIFQNLVSNAIKFSKKGVVPEISIKAVKEEDLIHFSISDNGIGIHEKYFDTIFAVFKRLHSKSDYPGTGIGLAHCKKIVEMHKGSIWVESSPENGSTFHFTISTQLS
jgi:light-regulated signal transduction histidine kinase (bacteriophytochrome)